MGDGIRAAQFGAFAPLWNVMHQPGVFVLAGLPVFVAYPVLPLAAIAAGVRYGSSSLAFLFSPLPSMGGSRALFPPDFGYPLWATYVAWIAVVLLMYPLCCWYAAVKARRTDWWLGYL